MQHKEDNLQMACVRWFSYQHADLAPLLHHSPNGGRRNAREAARFKAMGTRSGFPDLFLAIPSNGYHGLFVELKSEIGRLTENQETYGELLRRQGYAVVVVRDLDTFIEIVENHLYKRL